MNPKIKSIFSYLFLAFFTVAIAYSVFVSFYPNDNGKKQADIATAKSRKLCEVGIAKSSIIVSFMTQAADIRRAQAAAETNKIAAANDLAAAKKYEDDARDYARLTVKNC